MMGSPRPPWARFALWTSALWLLPNLAFAGGGGASAESTATVVALLIGVGIAYLFANFVVERVQKRFLVVAGVEYLVLGLLLGPSVPQIHVLDDIAGLLPLIALAAGWVGLLRGMEFDIDRFRDRPPGALRTVAMHILVPGALVGGLAYMLLFGGLAEQLGVSLEFAEEIPWRAGAASCFLLGCAAASDSSEPYDLLSTRYEIEGELSGWLRACTRLGDFFVIVVFGLLFCIFHPRVSTHPTEAEWFLIQVALGVGLGALFVPFLGGHETPNGRFLALVGIITFASGAAYFLELSPLAVNVFLGFVLVNVARTGRQMLETLNGTERPMWLVLLVLAGALWHPPPLVPTLVALAAFILLRLIGKWTGSRLAAWGMDDMRPDLYRGFTSHGGVAVAMAVSFQVVFDGVLVDIAYTVVLASVVLHDLVAPRVLRGLLVDSGDIRREKQKAPYAQNQEAKA